MSCRFKSKAYWNSERVFFFANEKTSESHLTHQAGMGQPDRGTIDPESRWIGGLLPNEDKLSRES